MTRPRPLEHRPGCPRTGTHTSRIGSWLLERCNDCRATGIRPTEPTERQESQK